MKNSGIVPPTADGQLPTALYLHIPFCIRRCLYCDFYVLPLGNGSPAARMKTFRSLQHDRFVNAIDRELRALPEGFAPATVYIGGGTPTELPPADLARIFDLLDAHLDLSQVKEFTCEANPGTLDEELAATLLSKGVTRISLGVQSFIDSTLQALGRIHSAEEAEQSVAMLRNAGCTNLSLDLLFGLPDTQPGDIDRNLEVLQQLNPDHVSWYSLEFEAGTAFTELRDSGHLIPPTEEQLDDEYRRILEGLTSLGYEHYELFSFTRPGNACLHNLNYWRGGDYLGIGPSAHSHVNGRRWRTPPDLENFSNRSLPEEQQEELPGEEKARETLMTSLRILEGVSEERFKQQTGYSIPDLLGDRLEAWIRSGWVQREHGRLRLLPEAYLISDHLFREFI